MQSRLLDALDLLAPIIPADLLSKTLRALAPLLDAPTTKPRRAAPKAKRKNATARSEGAVERAIALLKAELANGPRSATDVEVAAEKMHISTNALGRARTDLGIVAARARINGVGPQVITWALPAT